MSNPSCTATSIRSIIPEIQKRDGRRVPFDFDKIEAAALKALNAVDSTEANSVLNQEEAQLIARSVCSELRRAKKLSPSFIPTVEHIQDLVEKHLLVEGHIAAGKHFILYREERSKIRKLDVVIPEHVKELAASSAAYFKDNPLGAFVYTRSYAKWLESEGRRETWIETVGRYMTFMRDKIRNKLTDQEYSELTTAILEHQVMPSMRLMQFAGDAAARDNMCCFNCSYLAPSCLSDFAEIMYISMRGTGVGFSVESANIQALPQIKRQQLGAPKIYHVVGDSAEGWCDALTLGIETWYDGRDIEFDYSQVRPAGSRLKTMGGKASGPGPLKDLLAFTRSKILARQGKRLRNIDAHDIICMIGNCVVVGGVRRSAMISLSDLDDPEMRDAKRGKFFVSEQQRAIANNSAVYLEKPSNETFMDEWLALIKSHSGERGIFNRGDLLRQIPLRRVEAWRQADVVDGDNLTGIIGTNPCVPGNTPILTDTGYRLIEETIGEEINIWNGEEWSKVSPFSTGFNDTILINFSDFSSLRCTPNHKFILKDGSRVQADDLKPGDQLAKFKMPVINSGEKYDVDAYSQGFYAGDGNRGYEFSFVYEPKEACIPRLKGTTRHTPKYKRHIWKHGPMLDKDFVPTNGSLHYRLNWLAGLIDSDGTGSIITDESCSVQFQIGSINLEFLKNVKLMLTTLGVCAKIRLEPIERTHRPMYDRDFWKNCPQEFQGKPCYGLLINGQDSYHLMSIGLRLNRVKHHGNPPQRDARRFVRITSVEDDEPCETFCYTEPKAHRGTFNGIVTGQCGEILLRSKQLCNLTEVVARAGDTYDDLLRKVRLATILGTYQSMLTNFQYVSSDWKTKCDEERLLGVSITGQWDCETVRQSKVLEDMKHEAVTTNFHYAKRFELNPSTAITCVKPSGTVSTVINSSSGMHARHAPFYVRRIRISATDSLFKLLRDQGAPVFPEVGQDPKEANTWIVEFPVRSPRGAICRDDLCAIEQLEHWKHVKVHYTEHNPSTTISVGDDEWIEVANWIYKNWELVGGLAFLPRENHVYEMAPYEQITEEEYIARVDKFPTIDYGRLYAYEREDETELRRELACAGGVCEIV